MHNLKQLCAALAATITVACGNGLGSGDLLPGETCADDDACAWNDDNPGFCADDNGMCMMACGATAGGVGVEVTSCLPGTLCMTETVLDVSWSYCLATCSVASGETEDCPSPELSCVKMAGANVCVLEPGSLFY